MRISTLAAHGALILLAIGPAAAAQDANTLYREKMDQLTRKRTVDPVRPGDEVYSCAEIRAELSRLDRQLAGDMGAIRAPIEAEHIAKPGELAEDAAIRKARDAANLVAPVGTAPGNLIEEAHRLKVIKRDAARQHDYLLLAGKMGTEFNFIAARIPYLHKLAAERCTPEDQEVIARNAAAGGGPTSRGTSSGRRRVITHIDREQGGIVGGTMGRAGKGP